MEEIKKAFSKVKEDINYLNAELKNIKNHLDNTNKMLFSFHNQIIDLKLFISEKFKKIYENQNKLQQNQAEKQQIPISTDKSINSTEKQNMSEFVYIESDKPTDNLPFKDLKSKIKENSIGNNGVPTDRQTDRQTVKSIENKRILNEKPIKKEERLKKPELSEIFMNLEALKEDIKKTLQSLTKQELIIFSTIYQLEEEKIPTDYRTIAKKLSLTEGTIRDHVQRLFAKQAPIIKEKIDNKRVLLHIQPEFKKMLSLQSLINFSSIK